MTFNFKVSLLLLGQLIVSVLAWKSPALIPGLKWRSALKTFKPIEPTKVDIGPVLEAARLAPSSFGLQPYNIHVVTNPELKKELGEVSFGQPQVCRTVVCSDILLPC